MNMLFLGVALGLGFFLSGCGSGGGSTSDGGSSDPEGPRILSFGANQTTLTDDSQSLILTAVITDPDGIDDLVGGNLTDDTGATLGAFATAAQEGAYSITLGWSALTAPRPDVPAAPNAPVTISLKAEFFDQAGHTVDRTIDVSLSCGGNRTNLKQVGKSGCSDAAMCGALEEGGLACVFPSGPKSVTGEAACQAAFSSSCTECRNDGGVDFACGQVAATPNITFCQCQQ